MENTIGQKIKVLRVKHGYTQEQMGNEIGVTQSNYGRLEKKYKRINVVTLKFLAKFFNVPVTHFFENGS
nr:helix-turn-helix transcriptional regulator [uncultured Flavobacterium sp.]